MKEYKFSDTSKKAKQAIAEHKKAEQHCIVSANKTIPSKLLYGRRLAAGMAFSGRILQRERVSIPFVECLVILEKNEIGMVRPQDSGGPVPSPGKRMAENDKK